MFIYHQLRKETHSMESPFVAMIYSVMPLMSQICDLQLGCTPLTWCFIFGLSNIMTSHLKTDEGELKQKTF